MLAVPLLVAFLPPAELNAPVCPRKAGRFSRSTAVRVAATVPSGASLTKHNADTATALPHRARPRQAPGMGAPISWKLAPAVRAQHFFEQNLASSFKSKDTVKFTRARLHTLQRTGIDHSLTALLQPVVSYRIP